MKENPARTQVAATRSPGLHNDFSEQEETMTRSAMPPAFALTAGTAGVADPAKTEDKPRLNITGVPPELVKLLEDFEGIRWNVYEDHLGNLTGGMGHLIKPDEKAAFPDGAAITEAKVQAWAQADVTAAWQTAQEQSAELGVADHDFYVAMASMCFQNGLSWNGKHQKTWALMKEHKWEEAALECADSKWARVTPTRVPGFQAALRSQIAGGGTNPVGTANVETHIAEPFRKRADAAKAGGNGKESKAATAMPEGKEGMKQVQTKLQALGLYEGKIDGIATSSNRESNTTKGIKQFQQSRGLPVTGEVDAATWAALGGGRKPSAWKRFMAKQEGAQKAEKGKDEGGLAAPFREMADEAKRSTSGDECADSEVTGSGNFMDDSHFFSQNKETGPKGNKVPNPDRSMANAGGAACRKVASEMLIHYLAEEKPEMMVELGVSGIGDLSVQGNFLRILDEDKSHKSEVRGEKNESHPEWMVSDDQAPQAIAYIDGYLQRNIPVLVGVDHTYNRDLDTKVASKTGNGYNEGTTDHYLTLSGIGKDEQGRKYYSFFDPGRDHPDKGSGSNDRNRLLHEGGTRFKTSDTRKTGSSDSQVYHLSMVVIFPADRAKLADELKKNNASWID